MTTTTSRDKKKAGSKSKKSVAPEPTVWQPPPAKRPDIFMTLPPELRNVIYADVLKEMSLITLLPADMTRKAYIGVRTAWLEPGILQVSKAIRSEATSIYYGDNDFDIVAPLWRGPELCTMIRQLIERCGPRPFRSLRILIGRADWKSMDNGRLLGMLFYETGLQAHPVVRREGIMCNHRSGVHTITSNYCKVEAVLRLAVELGEKGARESWSKAEMGHKYVEWARLCETAKTKGINSKAWVKGKAALQA
ncbi:hypothetical protein LTR97_007092 [Elasticomyces elasticus]|uniref:Uncharacterized protein n=1 Tax=Elasticomyces elasticus TaxID=574655 RepID=A0AAN7ZN22_9PEZI|nr:hypothetical protein LTR97_007092 [Elasticomyces elasticus]